MANAQLDPVLHHVRGLIHSDANERTDRQLLDAYTRRDDHEAFAVLVQRYARLVLGTCRRYMRQAQDAEDAFQATFLVLAKHARSIRKKNSLASWLHGVTYRIAMKSKRDAARRRSREVQGTQRSASTPESEVLLREALAVIDEEVHRLPEIYQTVFVLCCLDNHTKPEVAERLGLKEGTVSSRLAQARKLLEQRLTRRGITLGSTLGGVALSETHVLAHLTETTTQTALGYAANSAGVPVSAKVLSLVEGVTKTLTLTKSKLLLVGVLAVGLLTSLGLAFQPAQTPPRAVPLQPERKQVTGKAPQSTPTPNKDEAKEVTLRGKVIDSDGKPVSGADVMLRDRQSRSSSESHRATTTDAKGEFAIVTPRHHVSPYAHVVAAKAGFASDWIDLKTDSRDGLVLRLANEDLPLTGTVLDLEGKPISGAEVSLIQIQAPLETNNLNAWINWQRKRASNPRAMLALKATPGSVPMKGIQADYLLGGTRIRTKTDDEGRFTFRGLAPERAVLLQIQADRLETTMLRVLTRDAPKETTPGSPQSAVLPLPTPSPFSIRYTGFDLLIAPGKIITGTIRDKATKEPLAGIRVHGLNANSDTTDAQGRYRLAGLGKRKEYSIYAGGRPYLNVSKTVPDTASTEPIVVDFELRRGMLLEGRLMDKTTGKPVRGRVQYFANPDNPFLRDYPTFGKGPFIGTSASVNESGSFRVLAIPGPGKLAVVAKDADVYAEARLEGWDGSLLDGIPTGSHPKNFHAIVPIDVPNHAKKTDFRIELLRGKSRKGVVLDSDGKPLSGAYALGLHPYIDGYTSDARSPMMKSEKFTVFGLREGTLRPILFYHPERKLAKIVRVDSDNAPLTIRLEPLGRLEGVAVDRDGKPLENVDVRVSLTRLIVAYKDLPWAILHLLDDRLLRITKTDERGRFHVEGLVPGLNYNLFVLRGKLRAGVVPLIVQEDVFVPSGKSIDLGTLKQR